jgi:hypothetical protein
MSINIGSGLAGQAKKADPIPDHLKALPVFRSIGAPPERYADRIVGEMLRAIVTARAPVFDKIKRVIRNGPDGSPEAQRRLARRIEEAGRPFILGVYIEPGKRGRYRMMIGLIDGWDSACKSVILPTDRMPEKPWLACDHLIIISKGRGVYKYDLSTSLFVTHHALSRLAQRLRVKHPLDFLICVNNIWRAYQTENFARGGDDWVKDGHRLRFQLHETLSARRAD